MSQESPASTSAKHSGITFRVHKVKRDKDFVPRPVPAQTHIRRKYLDRDLQRLVRHACSHTDDDLLVGARLPTSNNLVNAATLAFDSHLGLRLRPQHFWLAITQALAMHVDGNSAALRDRLVSHEGKIDLKIDVSVEAVRGFVPQDWANVAAGFNLMMEPFVRPNVVADLGCAGAFSDTTAAEHVASLMTVMDTLKSFFGFKCGTCCGFPSITLEGTVADWATLRSKTETILQKYALPEFAETWKAALLPVLDRLLLARQGGAVDVEFWESMVKRGGTFGSGATSWISGWINVFFPLNVFRQPNLFCVPFVGGKQYKKYVKDHFGNRCPEQLGLEVEDFPAGLCSAPVTLDDQALEFRAGFVGVAWDEASGSVTPSVGWLVASGKSPRTKDHWGGEVIDPVGAAALVTEIGAVVSLEPFVQPPS